MHASSPAPSPRRRPAFAKTGKEWVERTLASLTVDEAIAHLLCPENRNYSEADWESLFDQVPLACLFGRDIPVEKLQCRSRRPLLIAGDLEHGAGAHLPGCTDFPWSLAVGAAHSVELTRRMGTATAAEGLSRGTNWTFSPCVDLSLNANNPVVNIRSMGDDPRRVAKLAAAWIKAMQRGGIAACAKHFPGDGVDDRDQHLCTSVNSLGVEAWWRTYGRVWRAVIEAGVMSIMPGHISFPAYEKPGRAVSKALPATLSRRLQIDLLRRELGFEGVIVSDAAPMIGLTSRVREEEAALGNILAGGDVFLFADPVADFGRLKAAWKRGVLTETRIRESVRRILTMKAKLGLHEPRPAARPDSEAYARDARALAEKAIVLYRRNAVTPIALRPGAKVLTVTLKYDHAANGKFSRDLPAVDEELRERGFEVTHVVNPSHAELRQAANGYDAVFVNFAIVPHAVIGSIRLTGPAIMPFWRAFWHDCPRAVFTTFGNPYHLYELPHLPNYWIAGGPNEVSQRAAVRAWLGEIKATAKCPVKIPGI